MKLIETNWLIKIEINWLINLNTSNTEFFCFLFDFQNSYRYTWNKIFGTSYRFRCIESIILFAEIIHIVKHCSFWADGTKVRVYASIHESLYLRMRCAFSSWLFWKMTFSIFPRLFIILIYM